MSTLLLFMKMEWRNVKAVKGNKKQLGVDGYFEISKFHIYGKGDASEGIFPKEDDRKLGKFGQYVVWAYEEKNLLSFQNDTFWPVILRG